MSRLDLMHYFNLTFLQNSIISRIMALLVLIVLLWVSQLRNYCQCHLYLNPSKVRKFLSSLPIYYGPFLRCYWDHGNRSVTGQIKNYFFNLSMRRLHWIKGNRYHTAWCSYWFLFILARYELRTPYYVSSTLLQAMSGSFS